MHISRRLPPRSAPAAARPGPAAASRRPPEPRRGAPGPLPARPPLGTHLGDHPLHFTRYSTLPCGAREAKTRRSAGPAARPRPPPRLPASFPPHLSDPLLLDALHGEDVLAHRRQLHAALGKGRAGRPRCPLRPSGARAPAAPAAEPTDTARRPRHRNPCKSRSETSGRRRLPGPAARQRRGRGIGAALPGSEAGRGGGRGVEGGAHASGPAPAPRVTQHGPAGNGGGGGGARPRGQVRGRRERRGRRCGCGTRPEDARGPRVGIEPPPGRLRAAVGCPALPGPAASFLPRFRPTADKFTLCRSLRPAVRSAPPPGVAR